MIDTLARLGDKRAIGPIIALLREKGQGKHERDSLGGRIFQALDLIGGESAVEGLLAVFPTAAQVYKADIILALRKSGNGRVVELLISLLHDDDMSETACKALASLGDRRPVPALIALLEDEMLSRNAADALGTLRYPEAIEPLAAALNNGYAVHQISRALLELGDSRGLDPLLSVLREREANDRDTTCLVRFGESHRGPLVVALLGESQLHQKLYAADVLCQIDEPSVRRLLPELIRADLGAGGRLDARLGRLASYMGVGVDARVAHIGYTALSNTYKIVHGSSSGGNFSKSDLGSLDMSTLRRLCEYKDIWSSWFLYKMTQKKDATVTLTTCAPGTYQAKLSFEAERQMARDELTRRGLNDIDPLSQL